MILVGLGIVLMLAGIVLLLYQSAQNWSSWRVPAHDAPPRPAVPKSGVILIGMGALLAMLATSGWF